MRYRILAVVIGLFCSPAAYSQSLTNEQTIFLKRNAKTIHQDSSQKQPDWSFLSSHVNAKKLILIGELNHGSKEIFELRNSLIKYLHQATGTKAILFESGIGELIAADLNRADMSPSQMTNGLFGGWRTKEFVELMDFAKAQNNSVSGFDVQRTGGSFNSILNEIAQKYKLDTTLRTDRLESRYGLAARELTSRKAVYDSLKTGITNLIIDYQKVKTELSKYITKEAPKELLFAGITIENRIKYLSYMLLFLKDKNWNNRWAARDSAMANNVQWLINNVYKDQPVIIIGHNFHIGKHNENETVMGEILKAEYNAEMYSIGIFAGSGAYNDNSGNEVKMIPPDSAQLDIKHIIANLQGITTFVDIPDKPSKGSDWLNKPIIINDTFIDLQNSNHMILSKTFDGLILLKSVSPPKVD